MTPKRPEIENHALVGEALIYLAEGLRPFVEGKLQEFHGDDWEEVAKDSLDDKQFHIQDGKVNLQDAQALLQIIIRQQKEAFVSVLSRDEISLVYEVAQKRRELPGEGTRDGQFLDKLLREISAKLKKRDKLVIVVDALDEVDSRDRAGANILYLPVSLPQEVYLVMTSRPEKLPLRANSIPQRFDLMQYQAESLADIQTYIRANMSGKLREWIGAQGLTEEEFVRELAQKSENNFMYLRYVLGDIEQGKYDDLTIDRLPAGLEQYYDEHWRRMGMLTEPLPMHKVAIVYFLAELREPVSRRMLVELSDENPVIVQNVLKEWKQFLREVTVDGETRYGVYHQSFCDFLARQDIVEAYGDEY